MKTIKKTIITIAFFTANLSFGQDQIKPTCTVLNIQVKGEQMISSSEAGNITRHLMNKLSIYTILYDQDINYALTEKSSDLGKKLTYDCYSIQCLDNVGKLLNSNKMLSGYVERIRGNIIISFRELDVSTSKITNSISREYKDIPTELKNMVFLTLQEMYGVEREKQMIDYLTQINSREGVPNNPDVKRLNHSGVRMGVVHILGDNGDILKRPAGQGGYDASATLFQFGYQFETQYLNQGRVQGLFEFIPTITGLEQGLFLPSLTVLHGLRDNKTGLEFAFGPTFGVSKVAKGYFDDEVWKLRTEWDQEGSNPNPIVTRLDSRG
ncbi:MAG: hypothetical protein ABF270_03280, partial [Flavobacteriales bacterium]